MYPRLLARAPPKAGDGAIDRLVYGLYNLSEEEVKIVEEELKNNK